ncbi:isoprenylcysteine carboxylmethyltransferase family protein [Mycetocola zhadangensis]|uniref:Isoprenylcysteine carboxylmethyltransferase family protein n=1 Tax=Mycetocola zhadangensis TaxID=1164595 RepID=A0A3L7J3W8_9MICO|nr:isoprenylcysteine carboxylmethyltransferase family protein [Mycetocola zhadangensis]RLQ84141.1 isoprenylcysteine carboxylmethyltransferase family protein [Mycetocola zhadangensis]GGE95826.1 protein-S-isoprenylcysteine O-methyltransferase [Mycetocola zhadangensis]
MRWGRIYFAVQAAAGAIWWFAVFTSPFVREATLGGLDPVLVACFDIPLFVVASAIAACGVRSAAAVTAGWTGCVAMALAVYATVTTEAGWGVIIMIAATVCSALALCLLVLGRVPTSELIRGPFAFRPAAVAPAAATHVARTFRQIAVFWGLFLVVIPLVVAALERRWELALPPSVLAATLGGVVLIAASALGIWAAVTMSTLGNGTPLPSAMPHRLVVAGPYLWVRNPMAVSGIVQGIGVGLLLSSWLVVIYAIAGSLLWNFAIRPHEESDLEQRFGEEFRRYTSSVRCWIPRVPRAGMVHPRADFPATEAAQSYASE